MEYLKPYEVFIAPLTSLLLMAIIVPYLRRLYRLHREHGLMIRRKLLEHTGVVIYGVFDGKLQSDYLGGFLTAMFGETLFELIIGWNDQPSPSIIVPKAGYQCEHLEEILAAHASPFVLQSGRIECYFHGVEVCGTPCYPFARYVVALARPDASQLTSHDYPRVIIIERNALRKLCNEGVLPQNDTKDGLTWMQTLRELARDYFGGDRKGIVVLEVPLAHGPQTGTRWSHDSVEQGKSGLHDA